MARKTRVILTDDLDGSDAAGTVSFELDGVAYEIDLNHDNAQQLREQLGEWGSKGRRVGGRRFSGTRGAGSPSNTSKFWAWTKDNGHVSGHPGHTPYGGSRTPRKVPARTDDDTEYLTPAEVASLFGVSAKTVAAWAKRGRLAYILTPGGHHRYLKSKILDLASYSARLY